MTGTEGATAEAKTEGSVSKEVATEIEEALSQEVPKPDEEKEIEEKTPVENTPPEEGEADPADKGDEEGKESDQEPQGEESPDEPEVEEDTSQAEAQADEMLTRAVRAGMNLKDARTIVAQDASTLERQIQLLEKTDQASEGNEEAGAGESAAADEDPLAGIPDLDPEVYDENIVSGFQAMKSVIRKQGETIKQLSSGGEKSWFNQQVESLGVKNLDAAKRTELSEQFDVLKAGYTAKGQKVDDADVFQKATKLTLGDDLKATAEAKKGEKLKKRAKLQTARPGGPAAKAKGDPLDEVAEEVNKRFFGKK